MEQPTCGFDKPNPVPTSPQSLTIYPALPKPWAPTTAVHLITSPRDLGAPQE